MYFLSFKMAHVRPVVHRFWATSQQPTMCDIDVQFCFEKELYTELW